MLRWEQWQSKSIASLITAQLKAVYDFSSRLEKECPGCQVTNFQSVEKGGVEILIQCPNTQYLDRICELSIEVGDQYEIVLIPTPLLMRSISSIII